MAFRPERRRRHPPARRDKKLRTESATPVQHDSIVRTIEYRTSSTRVAACRDQRNSLSAFLFLSQLSASLVSRGRRPTPPLLVEFPERRLVTYSDNSGRRRLPAESK